LLNSPKLCAALLWLVCFVFIVNPSHASEELDSVVIQLRWTHQFQFAGYYAAVEKGFYAEEGLDVRFRTRVAAESVVEPVINGDAEYGVADSGLVLARMQGAPVVLLSQIFQHSPLVFISKSDSNILSPYDMIGKRIMFDVESEGGTALIAMLNKTLGGLDKITTVPHSINGTELIEDEVDAAPGYVTNAPFMLRQLGIDINIIEPRDYGVDFYGDNLFTTEKEMRLFPGRAERVRRATIKGWEYALKHPDRVIDLILEKYGQHMDRELLEYEARITRSMIQPEAIPIGTVDPEQYQSIVKVYADLGMVDSAEVPDGFIYPPPPSAELTPEERNWLKTHPEIRVGIMNDWPPISYIDSHGTPKGIDVDLVEFLNQRLGHVFTIVPAPFKGNLDQIKEKHLDVIMDVTPKPERGEFLNFTRIYVNIPHVLIGRGHGQYFRTEKDLAGKIVALEAGFYNVKYFKREHPAVAVREYPDTSRALDAVAKGEADAYAGNRAVATWIIEREVLHNLQLQGRLHRTESRLAFGVRKDWPELASIIDKTIAAMPRQEHLKIFSKWVGPENLKAKAMLELSAEEQAWVADHPVITMGIGVGWTPFVTQKDDGSLEGYDVDVLTRINELTGLDMRLVAGPRHEMVERAKHGKIDGLAESAATETRREYFSFTQPYNLLSYAAVALHEEAIEVDAISDLKGRRIALPKGMLWPKKLLSTIGDIQLIETESDKDSFQLVLEHKADFAIIPVSKYNQLHKVFYGAVKIAHVFNEDEHLLRLVYSIRKDWPELVSIINKALDAMSEGEKQALFEKWFPPAPQNELLPLTAENTFQQTFGLVVGILILMLVALWIVMRLIGKKFASVLQQKRYRLFLVVTASLFLTIIATFALIVLKQFDRQARNHVAEMTRVIVNTTKNAVDEWFRAEKQNLEHLSFEPEIVAAVEQLLETPRTRNDLIKSPALHALKEYFKRVQYDQTEFLVIASDFINIASLWDENVGWRNLISEHQPDLLSKVLSGATVFIPPVYSPDAIKDKLGQKRKGFDTMFVVSPLKDRDGTVIAAVAMGYAPAKTFNRLCQSGETSLAGATYLFDSGGRVLSQTRFEESLKPSEILQVDDDASFGLRLHDPGERNIHENQSAAYSQEQPLTHMAAAAVTGKSGLDINGYRNYQGTRVLGAWIWDNEFQIGLATEIDEKDALKNYLHNRNSILGMLTMLVMLTSFMVAFLVRSGERIKQELGRARDDWERVAERRSAELEFESKRRQKILESVPDGIIILDEKGIITVVNGQVEAMSGYRREEMVGQPIEVLVAEEFRDVVTAIRSEYRKNPSTRSIEEDSDFKFFKLKTKNGTLVPVEITLNSLNTDQGLLIIISVHDVTERINHFRKIHESEKQYRFTLDLAADAIITIDENGTIQEFNKSAERYFGYTADEIIGEKLSLLIPKPHKDKHQRYIRNYIKTGIGQAINQTTELLAEKKNGTIFPIDLSLAEIELNNKRIFTAIIRDISHRKQIEETLKESKEIAEKATRIKSEFLANMSHEIRTPLNSVLGFLELVLEDVSLTEIQRQHLTTAQISASSLLGLINDILDLSKLERGKLTLEERVFSLRRLLERIYATLKVTAQAKGIQLHLDIQSSLADAFIGDPMRLRQIIINLAGNAIKFTENGSVNLRVRQEHEEDTLHFMIEDTGVGISADRLKQIFAPFIQGDSSISRKFGGTGLGTTIAKELTELMGGRIWAESEEGKGSIFHFTARISPTDQIPKEAASFIVPGETIPSFSIGTCRVLLAEDVNENVQLATIHLERQGHKITVALNGQEAVEAFQKDKFDIVLMDIHMPIMDGVEATRIIRDLEKGTGTHVPIIAMTAAVMREEWAKYLEAGMDDVVAKPINFNKLFKIIEKVVPEDKRELLVDVQESGHSSSETALPPLAGIDTEEGIRRWQDSKAYVKGLISFLQNYSNTPAKLAVFLNEGDFENAYRLAHTLKGVASNLSVTEVADVATRIDALIKEKRIEDVKEHIVALDSAMGKVVASIRQLETVDIETEAPKKELNIPHLKELFVEMLAAFDQYSPYAIEPYLSELRQYLSQDDLKPIISYMDRFDFDGAKQQTAGLAGKLHIDLGNLDGK